MNGKARALASLGPLLGSGLLLVALFILARTFEDFGAGDVWGHLKTIPGSSILAALSLTALCHLVLTAYDTLAGRCLKLPVPYRKTALAAFLGYAFSHSLGFSMFSGAPIRYRLYSTWGISTKNVAYIVALNSLSWWLGLMVVGGSTLVLFGVRPSAHGLLAVLPWKLLGLSSLLIVGAYLLSCSCLRALRFRRWSLSLPPFPLALSQVAVSCGDWCLTASILYVLMPPMAVSFGHFLGVFVLAQAIGLFSQVPAGLGIMDSAIISLLPGAIPGHAILSSLIAFRLIYTLAPLVLAFGLLAVFEVRRRQADLRPLHHPSGALPEEHKP